MMTARSLRRTSVPKSRCVIAIFALTVLAGGCSLTRPAPIK
jgi:hypothetical protein